MTTHERMNHLQDEAVGMMTKTTDEASEALHQERGHEIATRNLHHQRMIATEAHEVEMIDVTETVTDIRIDQGTSLGAAIETEIGTKAEISPGAAIVIERNEGKRTGHEVVIGTKIVIVRSPEALVEVKNAEHRTRWIRTT